MPSHLLKAFIGIFVLLSSALYAQDFHTSPVLMGEWDKYLHDTLKGIECLRTENGLLVDKVFVTAPSNAETESCPIAPFFDPTSPSNIAMDLLIQLELYSENKDTIILNKISKILKTLQKMPYNRDAGLFYSRYWPDSLRIDDRSLSSVDNLHLAFSLWVASETLGGPLAREAHTLFKRMDFLPFYNYESGLIHGVLRENATYGLIPDRWEYGYFGSEARSIYALGWALGLFRISDTSFVQRFFKNASGDIYSDKPRIGKEYFSTTNDNESNEAQRTSSILRTWDGGAFQLLLPNLILGEENYSKNLGAMFKAFGRFIIAEGKSRDLPVPAAHSASEFSVFQDVVGTLQKYGFVPSKQQDTFYDNPGYNGKAGNLKLVSLLNKDVEDKKLHAWWESVFTPHALFMAASVNPTLFATTFKEAEGLHDKYTGLYRKSIGWLDGLHVAGNFKGRVVNSILSFDQSLIALSLFQIKSRDGMSLAAKTLHNNDDVRKKLEYFYNQADIFLENL